MINNIKNKLIYLQNFFNIWEQIILTFCFILKQDDYLVEKLMSQVYWLKDEMSTFFGQEKQKLDCFAIKIEF